MAGKLIDLNAYRKTRKKQPCSQQSNCKKPHDPTSGKLVHIFMREFVREMAKALSELERKPER